VWDNIQDSIVREEYDERGIHVECLGTGVMINIGRRMKEST